MSYATLRQILRISDTSVTTCQIPIRLRWWSTDNACDEANLRLAFGRLLSEAVARRVEHVAGGAAECHAILRDARKMQNNKNVLVGWYILLYVYIYMWLKLSAQETGGSSRIVVWHIEHVSESERGGKAELA